MAGYESSGVDPWSSGPSWEEPNPYAAPTYEASSRNNRKNGGGGSLKLAGIGLLVQAWSYIGIIVVFFSMIAIGVIVALTRSGGGGGIGPSEVGIMFAGLGLILLIPLGIAILVGYVLCVFVPPKSNARTPMIIALVLSVLMFLFSILEAVGTAFNSPGAVFAIAGLRLVMWIVLVVWVMQLFLMFRLGTAMKNY